MSHVTQDHYRSQNAGGAKPVILGKLFFTVPNSPSVNSIDFAGFIDNNGVHVTMMPAAIVSATKIQLNENLVAQCVKNADNYAYGYVQYRTGEAYKSRMKPAIALNTVTTGVDATLAVTTSV